MLAITCVVLSLSAPVPKNEAANTAATKTVLAELGLADTFGKLSDVPEDYRTTADELKKIRENADEFPLRATILKAGERIAAVNKTKMATEFAITDYQATKRTFRGYKKDLANRIVELEEALDELHALGRFAGGEDHPRWKAHYEFLVGYIQVEIAKAHEFNLSLARFNTNSPDEGSPEAGKDRFQFVPVERMNNRK